MTSIPSINELLESAFGGSPNNGLPSVGYRSVDGSDIAAFDLTNPDLIDRLNWFLSKLSDKPTINPYYLLTYLRTKFNMISFDFELPSISGDSGNSVSLLKRGGEVKGQIGKDLNKIGYDSGTDWGIEFSWTKYKGQYTIQAKLVNAQREVTGEKIHPKPDISAAPHPKANQTPQVVKEGSDFLLLREDAKDLKPSKISPKEAHLGNVGALSHGFVHLKSSGLEHPNSTLHNHEYEHKNGRKLILQQHVSKNGTGESHEFLFTKGPSHRRWPVYGTLDSPEGYADFHSELTTNNKQH